MYRMVNVQEDLCYQGLLTLDLLFMGLLLIYLCVGTPRQLEHMGCALQQICSSLSSSRVG